jgi:hypothetical protein
MATRRLDHAPRTVVTVSHEAHRTTDKLQHQARSGTIAALFGDPTASLSGLANTSGASRDAGATAACGDVYRC